MIKKLNDTMLVNEAIAIRKKEKAHTLKLLEYLEEIQARQLYAEHGCRSLFEFCTEVLDYSKGEAIIRVNACRLAMDTPEAKEKIATGQLSLTSASHIQAHARAEGISAGEKSHLVRQCAGKSVREIKNHLDDRSSGQKAAGKTLKLPSHLMNKLKKLQELMDAPEELECLEALIDEKMEQFKAARARRERRESRQQRHVSRPARENLLRRAGHRCEYVNVRGERCRSRTLLQVDHIRPIARGGTGAPENLRLLCRSCNKRAWTKLDDRSAKISRAAQCVRLSVA